MLTHVDDRFESADAEAEHRTASLHREFGGPLRRHVRGLTGNDLRWTEDVVREAIGKAGRDPARRHWESSLLWAWLVTESRRLVRDGRRRDGARSQEAAADGAERPLSAIVVLAALRDLSEEHREVIEQTYLRDRTISEAAEILGIPPGTVKSRLYYGIKALRALLANKGVAG
ncbi:sigma-70 family RNA polymerase sigma factor [Nonomuraea cavernae]|uniref:sigma-70 family RNA polymerase sigma factor n=1 Tax=Nonomuraea cavernae TaxID=2045107 RepID=UPI0033F7F7E2